MNLPTSTSSSALGSQKAAITPTTTTKYLNIPIGYNSTRSYYKLNAMTSGSATTPATTITANPSISVSNSGLITATASATQSVTPTVSAGYVDSGTAGTITVSGSNTSQLTTQAATTYTPTTTDQTIASGKYLTGAQTILGDANLTAENIKKDVSIFGVTGTYEGSGGGGGTVLVSMEVGNGGGLPAGGYVHYLDEDGIIQSATLDLDEEYNWTWSGLIQANSIFMWELGSASNIQPLQKYASATNAIVVYSQELTVGNRPSRYVYYALYQANSAS
jgi:hypothetical protein